MKILATAKTLDRLKKYISDYWGGAVITLIEVNGKTLIHSSYNNAATVPEVEVVGHRGGFAFIRN